MNRMVYMLTVESTTMPNAISSRILLSAKASRSGDRLCCEDANSAVSSTWRRM